MAITTILTVGIALLSVSPNSYNSLKDDIQNINLTHVMSMQASYLAAYIMANSHLDLNLYSQCQEQFSSPTINNIAKYTKTLGEINLILGYSTALCVLEFIDKNITPFPKATYALEQIMKAYIIGGPICLISQRIIGAPRPVKSKDSSWNFGATSTGVSGHALFSAIPFFVLSNLSNKFSSRAILSSIALLGGFSRIIHKAHYPSQVLLGWMIAKNAADVVTAPATSSKSMNNKSTPTLMTDMEFNPLFVNGNLAISCNFSY